MSLPIPRILTRGYYDLATGRRKSAARYRIYPKRSLEGLCGKKEISIMVHGLRNDAAGAVTKFEIARKRLRKIGYVHPVIGYSYDSNTRGAHLEKTALRALRTGQIIAQKNGRHLAQFVCDFAQKSPGTRLRLLGHSLGSQVILSTIEHLAKSQKNDGIIEAVYLFGASIGSEVPGSRRYGPKLQRIIRQKIVNYYAPTDEVLGSAPDALGLRGASGATIPKYAQKRIRPKNHRFKSYAAALASFP